MEPGDDDRVQGDEPERVMSHVSARKRIEPFEERSDEDLIQVVAQGERAAFETLVRRHKSRLYNYLLRLLRDPTDAEEVAQETFVRASHRSRDSDADGPGAPVAHE